MNLLHKVSRFLHDLQVNVLLTNVYIYIYIYIYNLSGLFSRTITIYRASSQTLRQ